MKNVANLLKNRKSNREIVDNKDFEIIKNLINSSYDQLESHHTVASAGSLFGLTLNIFTKNRKYSKTINSDYFIEEFSFEIIKKYCFPDDLFFSEESILIAIDVNYNLYSEKYSNCAIRYASIEAGEVLQNIQLLLLEIGIQGYTLGFVPFDEVLNLQEVLIFYVIY